MRYPVVEKEENLIGRPILPACLASPGGVTTRSSGPPGVVRTAKCHRNNPDWTDRD